MGVKDWGTYEEWMELEYPGFRYRGPEPEPLTVEERNILDEKRAAWESSRRVPPHPVTQSRVSDWGIGATKKPRR